MHLYISFYPTNNTLEPMDNESIRQYIRESRNDPSLLSTIDIDQLLDAAENTRNQYLENETLETISRDIFESLREHVPPAQIHDIYSKLVGYRYIEEIYQLHRGKHVRWIRFRSNGAPVPTKLTRGGVAVDVKIQESGVNVMCRMQPRQTFIQYKFDDCLTYQKLSEDELLILAASHALTKPETNK